LIKSIEDLLITHPPYRKNSALKKELGKRYYTEVIILKKLAKNFFYKFYYDIW